MGTSMGSGYIHPVDTSAGVTKVIPDGNTCLQTTSEEALSTENLLFYDLRESGKELK